MSPGGPPNASCLFYTEQQVADRWGVSAYTLYEMRRRGIGPRFNVFGRAAIRYSRDEVERFERSDRFQNMTEVYAARSGRAKARTKHRAALKHARDVLAEGRDRV